MDHAAITLIEGGEIYDPAPRGHASLLLCNDKIIKVGPIDRRALDALGLSYTVIQATNRLVLPGLIDPHEHLTGASGSTGFGTITPPIFFSEIITAGITTVVGTLGTDTLTTPMQALIARVKAYNELGISAYCYTGGYNVPPSTITGRIRDDLLLITEVIAAGEIAISDARSTDPVPQELARLVNDTYVGGLLTGKAGITHFHVGSRKKRLGLLRELIDKFDCEAKWLYPTHVERNEELMREAIGLVKLGATIDIDVVEKDLPRWLRYFLDHDGEPSRCTISSDAFLTSPRNLFEQVRLCIVEHQMSMELVLPMVTSNTAKVLKLEQKGKLEEGMDADVLIVERGSLEIVDVIARGRPMVRDGRAVVADGFLKESDRSIELHGAS